MDKAKKKVPNKILCNHCNDIIESKSVHDFKWCRCGKVAVDGGQEYHKRCGNEGDWSEWDEKDQTFVSLNGIRISKHVVPKVEALNERKDWMDTMKDKVFKLCFVSGNFAYFTSKPLDEQTGDDWDDAPYEHNAGYPYDMDNSDIIRILAYNCGCLETPAEFTGQGGVSVDEINSGKVAWFSSPSYVKKEDRVVIHAGVTMDEFKRLIKKAKGTVFVPEF